MFDGVKSWLQKPYSEDMTAFDWFLFFGLLIAISVLWRIILAHVLETTEELT